MTNRMRELRFFKGLTLDDIYLKTQIHQSRLSRLERGIFIPKDREMQLIAKALGEPVIEVFPEKQV